MAGGVKNYDYDEIENCIALMKNKVADIEERVGGLQREVQGLMGTWSGSTAVMYERTATDLNAELTSSSQSLDRTKLALQAGANAMQQTDVSGSKRIAQS